MVTNRDLNLKNAKLGNRAENLIWEFLKIKHWIWFDAGGPARADRAGCIETCVCL